VSLSVTFCTYIRTRLDRSGGKSLPEQVKEILSKDLDHSDAMHEETQIWQREVMASVSQFWRTSLRMLAVPNNMRNGCPFQLKR